MSKAPLVQWQILRAVPEKHIADQLPAAHFELLSSAKKMRVLRLVEQSLFEVDTPRVFVAAAILDLSEKYRQMPVNCLRKLGIVAGAEGRAGAGVGVQQRDVFQRQRKATLRVA